MYVPLIILGAYLRASMILQPGLNLSRSVNLLMTNELNNASDLYIYMYILCIYFFLGHVICIMYMYI